MFPLHIHSYYTLLNSTLSIDNIIKLLKIHNINTAALTDTANLYGTIEFYKKMKQNNLNPIIGSEIPINKNDYILLYAENYNGYKNLCKIISHYHLHNKNNITDFINHNHQGLIIAVHINNFNIFKDTFNKNNIFIELNLNDNFNYNKYKNIINFIDTYNIFPIVTNETKFQNKNDFFLFKILTAINDNTNIHNLNKNILKMKDAYFKTYSYIKNKYPFIHESFYKNTQIIADRCSNIEIPLNKYILPEFKTPNNIDNFTLLTQKVFTGLKKRYKKLTNKIINRFDHELDIINSLGYTDYFLIVDDIIQYTKRHNISTVGRGSAANSIVSYALEITHIDPIKHDLYFERFLNPDRNSPPDIDLDIAWNKRELVLDYIYKRFGTDNTAMISTMVRFRTRSAFREICKVFGYSDKTITKFSKKFSYTVKPDDIINKNFDKFPELKNSGTDINKFKNMLMYACRLTNFPTHLNIHCGGVVITPDEITNYTPLQKSANDLVITQYDMYSGNDIGLVKFDILGQRGLAVIDDTITLAKKNYNVNINFDNIDYINDPETVSEIIKGNTLGCFYIESPGMRQLLRKLKVSTFDLLVAASSIIRPGVSNSGMMDAFIKRHTGQQKTVYLHPLMKDILFETYGILIYQEDVMKVAHYMAGLSLKETDSLRRSMSKKGNYESLHNYKVRFVNGCKKNNVPEKIAEKIWNQIEYFSGYAFCKGHSASYADISFRCAYLKRHYPAEFMAAVISNEGGFYSTLEYVSETKRMKLHVHKPDINKSKLKTIGNKKHVLLGFHVIKNLSHTTIKNILNERNKNKFQSVDDFFKRISSLTVTEKEYLIKSGALDKLDNNKFSLLYRHFTTKNKPDNKQMHLFTTNQKWPIKYKLNKKDTIINELESTKTYITYHPAETITNKNNINIIDVPKYQNKYIWIKGIPVTRKTTYTKNNKKMGFVSLEDNTGLIEIVLFPKIYNKYAYLLKNQSFFYIYGKVENDNGGITVTVKKMLI